MKARIQIRTLAALGVLSVTAFTANAAVTISSGSLVASIDFGSIQQSGEPSNADGLQIPGQVGGWAQAPLTSTGNFTSTTTTTSGITWTWNPGSAQTVSAWPNGGTDPLRRDYYALNSPSRYSAPVTWELTGLTPNANYDLILYSLNTSQQGYFSIPGFDAGNGVGNNVTNDLDGDGNFLGVTADGTGKISGLMDVIGENVWATLAGVQIAELPVVVVPEPSRALLVGLGLLAFLRRRR